MAARWPSHPDDAVRPVDWRTAAVVAGSAVTFGLLLARWPEAGDRLVLGVYLAALMVLLATDLDQRLLPDVITLPLIPFALGAVLLGWDPLLSGKGLGVASAVAAGVGAPLLLLVTDRLFGGALGMGDVKLAASLGLMFGVTRLLAGFLLATIAGAAVLLVLMGLGRLGLQVRGPVRAHPHRRRGRRDDPALTRPDLQPWHEAPRLPCDLTAPSGSRAHGGVTAEPRGRSLRVVRPRSGLACPSTA
ncbi:MAG: A24 family peptidase [Chloroflexota bacterium]